MKIAGWLALGTAILSLGASFFVYQHTQKFIQSASRTKGTVSKLIRRPGDNSYYPIFLFEDQQGNKHSVDSLSGNYPAAYKVGDVVSVIYQTDNPENAEIDTFLNVWIWPMALAGFGVVQLLFGLGAVVFIRFIPKLQCQPAASDAA